MFLMQENLCLAGGSPLSPLRDLRTFDLKALLIVFEGLDAVKAEVACA